MPNSQQDKKRNLGELIFLRTFCLASRIQDHSLDTILDTGATVSAVAKRYTRNAVIDPHDTMYIRVGNGEVIHSMGSTEVEVDLGSVKCMQICQVLDTNAFDCVLGTDFLHSGPVNGLLLKPARLIVNNKEFSLRESGNQPQVHRLSGMFSTDDYKFAVRFETNRKFGKASPTIGLRARSLCISRKHPRTIFLLQREFSMEIQLEITRTQQLKNSVVQPAIYPHRTVPHKSCPRQMSHGHRDSRLGSTWAPGAMAPATRQVDLEKGVLARCSLV